MDRRIDPSPPLRLTANMAWSAQSIAASSTPCGPTSVLAKSVRGTVATPTLAVTGSYTRLDNDRVLGVGDMQRLVAGANQVTGSVTVSQALLAPGRWAQWLHADDAVRVGQIAQEDVRRQVAVATARAYLLVVTQARALEVAERARDTARAHHDFALRRLRGGLGNRLDEARALQEFQTAEAQLLGARAAGIFDRAVMHVPIETAREAREVARQLGADCAVAVGGGSTTGLGKAIVQHLLDQVQGYKKVILYAVPGKEPFYRKFGFRRMRTAMAIFDDPAAAQARGHIDPD